MKHRAQLLIEEWQYHTLKSIAERKGKSISHLIREILSHHLHGPGSKPKRHLAEIRGLGEDPKASGRQHDQFLYGSRIKP